MEVYGVSIHKKAHKYWALRTSMEFSRVYWSSIWWRRGELNPRPSVRGLRLYMHSVVY